MESKTIQHLDPVWKDKTNYILRVRIPGEFSEYSSGWEQLWTRKIDDKTYEVCCIPFFLYDLSLGDHIRVDREGRIIEVPLRSGHFTFRVWFGESNDPNIRSEVLQAARQLGCLLEFYNNNLLGVSSPNNEVAELMSGYLLQKQQLGLLTYETGQS